MNGKKLPTWLRVLLPSVLIVLWLAAGAVGGPYFGKIEEVSEVDLTAFLPESAEATKVNKKLGKYISDESLPAIVVFETENKKLSDVQSTQIEAIGMELEKLDAVEGSVSPPVVADDKQAAFIAVSMSTEDGLADGVKDVREAVEEAVPKGMTHHVTGPAGFAADLNVAFAGIDGILLLTALAVVFVILIFVYRSVLLPIAVLLTSIFALSASILLVFNLAKADIIQLNGQVQGILFILVIGAATDYSLLYVARFREALYEHKHRWQATLAAYKGTFEPILASGGTVIVGLLCLLVSDLASNKALGPVGSIGIFMAMASALSFLPAVLLLLGRSSFWPVMPQATLEARRLHKQKLKRGLWHRVGEFVNKSPRPIWLVTATGLFVAALFAPQINANGVPQSELILGYSEAREGQKVLSEHFPDGSGSPAQIIVDEVDMDTAVAAADATKGIEGVNVVATGVESGFAPLGEAKQAIENDIREVIKSQLGAQRAKLNAESKVIAQMAGPDQGQQYIDRVESNIPSVDSLVAQAYPFKDAKPIVKDSQVLLQATLANDPDSEAAKDTIVRLRNNVREASASSQVGGVTAAQLDTTTASIRDRMVIIPLVLVAITVILMLLLRSVVAPLLLLATTVLSFASSLGTAALLFNNALNFPGVDPAVVLYGFVFLVALGIDYNIFLMTRVREESLKIGTSRGVIKGLVVTGGVITSAGVVLAATFAALGVIPILFLFQLAFIVAFGVLLDTIIVRSLLVPALVKDIGSFVWWPSKLRHKK